MKGAWYRPLSTGKVFILIVRENQETRKGSFFFLTISTMILLKNTLFGLMLRLDINHLVHSVTGLANGYLQNDWGVMASSLKSMIISNVPPFN